MKLIRAADLIGIGISPDKIIEFNKSPIMLINNNVYSARAVYFDKLEDIIKLDWVNDINKGDAGIFIIYANPNFEETMKIATEQMKITEKETFILRIFTQE